MVYLVSNKWAIDFVWFIVKATKADSLEQEKWSIAKNCSHTRSMNEHDAKYRLQKCYIISEWLLLAK